MKSIGRLSMAAAVSIALPAVGLSADDAGGFSPQDVDTIAVLSVADLRKDRSVDYKKLDPTGHRVVRSALKKSAYTLQFDTDPDAVASLTEEDLEYLDAEWIRRLGPEDQRYVLLLVLEDAARKRTYGSAFGAVCSGYLFDKEKGQAVWQSHATGTAGQGGLVGFAMSGMMRSGAFASCAGNLMAGFPREKKRKSDRS